MPLQGAQRRLATILAADAAGYSRLMGADEYRASAVQAAMFLEGRSDAVLRELSERMEAHSKALRFEAAARIRDQMGAIERSLQQQKVAAGQEPARDGERHGDHWQPRRPPPRPRADEPRRVQKKRQ